ncbi:MAG TPA: sigma-70 family RNA polymerase sigma factor [Actinomycetota bacterium]|nr:sigma-70 family RNA polymerase sigma factor [Actinomycetota bacterium]
MSDPPGGPLTPQAEQELVRRLVAGDDDALRTLYRRFARPVYGMGLRILGSRESAEELTQDVFEAAWRKAERYEPARGRLSTWLMTIAHNMAVDRLRRESGRAAAVAGPVEELAAVGVSEEEAWLDREEARRILMGLSPAERKLLHLAYYRGWTAREIAEAEGIPLGTVKTRMRTTLMKLRARAKEA